MNTEKTLRIDVSKIYNGETAEIPFTLDFVPEDTEAMDIVFSEPVKGSGRVYEKARGRDKAESFVELVFTLSGVYETHCARCARSLTKDFSVTSVYGVSKKLTTDSEEYVEAPDGILDVYELIQTVFYLELPTKVLCKEDCKGLCPVCGKDQNEEICTCKKNIGANSLEGLKKLLDK